MEKNEEKKGTDEKQAASAADSAGKMPAGASSGTSGSSGAQQHEDAILKTSMQFFADELLPWLGIRGKVISFAPTELVQLEIHRFFQDFTLVMEDGIWNHFEFQSTNPGKKGMRRFRAYEALASYQHGVEIRTWVLYSGMIRKPMTSLAEGFSVYRVRPITLRGRNSDRLIAKLQRKIKRGEPVTKEDLVPLTLCPLMDGRMSLKERIRAAFSITRQAAAKREDLDRVEAMLYAMADKFLDGADLNEIKEGIRMTRLGQMLVNEGIEQGIQRGIEQGIQQGIEQGIQRGIQQERKRTEAAEKEVQRLEEELKRLRGRQEK